MWTQDFGYSQFHYREPFKNKYEYDKFWFSNIENTSNMSINGSIMNEKKNTPYNI